MTHLLSEEVGELGIAVTEPIDGNTGREVQVLAVVNVPYIRPFSFHEYRRRPGVCGDHEGRMIVDQRCAGRVGVGVWVRQVGLLLALALAKSWAGEEQYQPSPTFMSSLEMSVPMLDVGTAAAWE